MQSLPISRRGTKLKGLPGIVHDLIPIDPIKIYTFCLGHI